MLCHGILLDFRCVFRAFAKVLGISWKQRFCNTFFVKSEIPNPFAQCFVIWHTFLGLLSGAFFVVVDFFRWRFSVIQRGVRLRICRALRAKRGGGYAIPYMLSVSRAPPPTQG